MIRILRDHASHDFDIESSSYDECAMAVHQGDRPNDVYQNEMMSVQDKFCKYVQQVMMVA